MGKSPSNMTLELTKNLASSSSLHSDLVEDHTLNTAYLPGNKSEFALLNQFNTKEVQRLIPLIIYLVLISLVGIPGNGVVFHIYRTQYKRSNSVYFILCLSVIDFFTCMFVIPFEIYTNLNQYTFESDIACKLVYFYSSTPAVAAGPMFLLIAIDRYRKVCQPFKWQIQPKVAKALCVCTIFVGILLSWPLLILYGKSTFYIDSLNLNGTECSVSDSMKGKVYPIIYYSLSEFGTLGQFMFLVFLYVMIGKAIRKHAKDLIHLQSLTTEKRVLRNDSNDDELELSGTINNERSSEVNIRSCEGKRGNQEIALSHIGENYDIIDDEQYSKIPQSITTYLDGATLSKEAPQRRFSFQNETNTRTKVCKKAPVRSMSHEDIYVTRKAKTNGFRSNNSSGISRKLLSSNNRQKKSDNSRNDRNESRNYSTLHEKRMQRARKMSVIMFLITIVYILNYLPIVSLRLIGVINSGFVDSMTDGQRAVYKFFRRSYFLNCLVNPFIYSACSKKFRQEIKNLIKR